MSRFVAPVTLTGERWSCALEPLRAEHIQEIEEGARDGAYAALWFHQRPRRRGCAVLGAPDARDAGKRRGCHRSWCGDSTMTGCGRLHERVPCRRARTRRHRRSAAPGIPTSAAAHRREHRRPNWCCWTHCFETLGAWPSRFPGPTTSTSPAGQGASNAWAPSSTGAAQSLTAGLTGPRRTLRPIRSGHRMGPPCGQTCVAERGRPS